MPTGDKNSSSSAAAAAYGTEVLHGHIWKKGARFGQRTMRLLRLWSSGAITSEPAAKARKHAAAYHKDMRPYTSVARFQGTDVASNSLLFTVAGTAINTPLIVRKLARGGGRGGGAAGDKSGYQQAPTQEEAEQKDRKDEPGAANAAPASSSSNTLALQVVTADGEPTVQMWATQIAAVARSLQPSPIDMPTLGVATSKSRPLRKSVVVEESAIMTPDGEPLHSSDNRSQRSSSPATFAQQTPTTIRSSTASPPLARPLAVHVAGTGDNNTHVLASSHDDEWASQLAKVHREVQEAQDVLAETISIASSRSERLDSLDSRTSAIEASARAFTDTKTAAFVTASRKRRCCGPMMYWVIENHAVLRLCLSSGKWDCIVRLAYCVVLLLVTIGVSMFFVAQAGSASATHGYCLEWAANSTDVSHIGSGVQCTMANFHACDSCRDPEPCRLGSRLAQECVNARCDLFLVKYCSFWTVAFGDPQASSLVRTVFLVLWSAVTTLVLTSVVNTLVPAGGPAFTKCWAVRMITASILVLASVVGGLFMFFVGVSDLLKDDGVHATILAIYACTLSWAVTQIIDFPKLMLMYVVLKRLSKRCKILDPDEESAPLLPTRIGSPSAKQPTRTYRTG